MIRKATEKAMPEIYCTPKQAKEEKIWRENNPVFVRGIIA